jgi:hypothetical protein
MNEHCRTTYERATEAYDEQFERALVEAISNVIIEASLVTDANVMAIRTGETASALLTVLAGTLAMSPAVCRSPTTIRKTIDDLHKRLRRQLAGIEASPDLQEFLRRAFRGPDTAGNA